MKYRNNGKNLVVVGKIYPQFMIPFEGNTSSEKWTKD